jgi:hypothetical protein
MGKASASIVFAPDGEGRCLYAEAIDLHSLGLLHIERATSIEFDNERQLWRVRDTEESLLFTARTRTECLEWERKHIESKEDGT